MTDLDDRRSRGAYDYEEQSDYYEELSDESDQAEDEAERATKQVAQMQEELAHGHLKGYKTWNFAKRMVSMEKHRYQKEGFDLDLSYITKQIIAMGFPAAGMEGIYRNNMSDVQRFFLEKHPKKYKVYNLCTERAYDHSNFYSVSHRYKFNDHNPPPFHMIHEFCRDVVKFLSKSKTKDNVVAIHCKAGKGRTGVMICCYLVYAQICRSAHEALMYYGEIRTFDRKGVTIPS